VREPTTLEESLRSSQVCGRGLAASLLAVGIGLAVVPTASADPNDTVQTDSADNGAISSAAAPDSDDATPAAVTACGQFATALDGASDNYDGFAEAIEGSPQPDYYDPSVSSSNVVGRTGLRQAAATALSASDTPDLAPEISDPMAGWSVDATKLLLKMALHGGGDTLNTTANEMNADATNAQAACAAAGTHA
jgi:hypothetical protein